MIIELTGYDNQSVFINSDHIVQFRRLTGFTEIVLIEGKLLGVSESPEYIMETINKDSK